MILIIHFRSVIVKEIKNQFLMKLIYKEFFLQS